MMTRIASVLVGIALCVCSGDASAENKERVAGQKHNLAMRLFDLGRYKDAISALDDGYLINPRPSMIYNRAMMLNRLGDLELRFDRTLAMRYYVLAADSLRHYLDRQPDASDASEVRLSITSLYKIADTLDDKPKSHDAEPRAKDGSGATSEEQTEQTERAREEHAKRDRRDSDEERERRENRFRLVMGLVTGGGGVTLAASVGLLLGAESMSSEIRDLRHQNKNVEADEKADQRGAMTGVGVFLLLAGSSAAAAGVTLLVLPTKTRIRLFPMLGGLGGWF